MASKRVWPDCSKSARVRLYLHFNNLASMAGLHGHPTTTNGSVLIKRSFAKNKSDFLDIRKQDRGGLKLKTLQTSRGLKLKEYMQGD